MLSRMEHDICFACGLAVTVSGFYAHPQMAKGRLGKCKACTKADAAAARLDKLDEARAYDRARYAMDEGRRSAVSARARRRHADTPWATRARRKVAYHVQRGNIARKPCERCGDGAHVHAHHDDYSAPLDVTWLCPTCHSARHGELEKAGIDPHAKARAAWSEK